MSEKLPQVISVGRDGSISGLERKDGPVDLKKFGKADVERTSEVVWDRDTQKWYVVFRHTNPPQTLRMNLWLQVQEQNDYLEHNPVAYFKTYEDGVAAEIKTLDFLRKNGKLLCNTCGKFNNYFAWVVGETAYKTILTPV